MHLYLSSSTPWNCNYYDSAGRVLFTVEAPYRHITTVNQVQDNSRILCLAEIKWNRIFGSSRIKFMGEEHDASSILRKEGLGFLESTKLVLVGPDGREYKWKFGGSSPQLLLNDGSGVLVAKYHRSHLGIFHAARPASLEIFPSGEFMTELIIVTFILIEKKREDERRAAAAANAHTSAGHTNSVIMGNDITAAMMTSDPAEAMAINPAAAMAINPAAASAVAANGTAAGAAAVT